MLNFDHGALEFVWVWVVYLWPLPLLIRLLPAIEQSTQALRVPFFQRVYGLSQSKLKENPPLKNLIIALLIWSLFVLAAMRPQWVGEPIKLPVSGRSVMLAVDLSGSMKETDLQLNDEHVTRLAVVKSVLRPFIERRKGDRLGLILFGDQAYLQTPLTFDRKTLQQMLDEAELGLAGERTAIGNAIGLAVKKLKDLPDAEKVLVLLTDGRNTAGEVTPEEAAKLAKQIKMRIHSIGVGADEAWVRTFFSKQKVNPSAELDEGMLRSLATMTGGQYFRARSTQELEKIYSLIDQLEPIERQQETFRPRQALFFWPLAFAVFLLALWIGFSLRPNTDFLLNKKNSYLDKSS